MNVRRVALLLALAPAMGACADDPVAPAPQPMQPQVALSQHDQGQARQQGSGLILESLTGVALPLVGELGDVVIDQAVITDFALVENTVGQIIGLEAEGILDITGGVLGSDVVTEEFMTTVSITSQGFGQCDIVTIDLGPVALDVLGVAGVDVPAAEVTARGSGAVGSLLCAVGGLLGGLTGGAVSGVRGLVNALNRLI